MIREIGNHLSTQNVEACIVCRVGSLVASEASHALAGSRGLISTSILANHLFFAHPKNARPSFGRSSLDDLQRLFNPALVSGTTSVTVTIQVSPSTTSTDALHQVPR